MKFFALMRFPASALRPARFSASLSLVRYVVYVIFFCPVSWFSLAFVAAKVMLLSHFLLLYTLFFHDPLLSSLLLTLSLPALPFSILFLGPPHSQSSPLSPLAYRLPTPSFLLIPSLPLPLPAISPFPSLLLAFENNGF